MTKEFLRKEIAKIKMTNAAEEAVEGDITLPDFLASAVEQYQNAMKQTRKQEIC